MYGSLDIQSLVLLPSLPPYTIHLLTLQQHLTTLRYTIFPGSFIRVVNPHQDHHPYSYYGAMEHPCSPGPKHPSYSRSSTPKMPSTKRKSPWLGRQCRHPPPQAVDRLNQRLDHSDNSLYTLLHQRANAKTTSTTFITPISPIIFTHPHPTLPHNPTNQPPKCSSPSPPSSPSSQRPSPPQPGRVRQPHPPPFALFPITNLFHSHRLRRQQNLQRPGPEPRPPRQHLPRHLLHLRPVHAGRVLHPLRQKRSPRPGLQRPSPHRLHPPRHRRELHLLQ